MISLSPEIFTAEEKLPELNVGQSVFMHCVRKYIPAARRIPSRQFGSKLEINKFFR